VEVVIVVDEVIGRVDDWHDWRLACDGDAESAFFEGSDAAILVARSLGKEPQLDVVLGHQGGRVLQLVARLLRLEPVDENDSGQPGRGAEGPRVENFLFGDAGDEVRPFPEPEHAQHVEGTLVVGHSHATPSLGQDVQTPHLPPDAH